MNAARLWWLLRYLGHEQVYILEGGFSAWKAEKFPVTDHQPVRVPSSFQPNVQTQMLVDVDKMRQVSAETGLANPPASAFPIIIDSCARKTIFGFGRILG
ncbi:hypothetical protein GCM10010912_10720 [Paenibacillus albidus]|uniref:Rhodanese domain-containing protein n=1 Tax=Paenibacillus albidus TaxID=2041023 RepID=A0A917C2I8_9BACL|nr:hypothetical protein GCM10010912_10720 [Paenibacillus albidus]